MFPVLDTSMPLSKMSGAGGWVKAAESAGSLPRSLYENSVSKKDSASSIGKTGTITHPVNPEREDTSNAFVNYQMDLPSVHQVD